jgi:hypothetical protein
VSAPAPLYYVAIDGTSDLDAATFGALLEKHRHWKNLASTYFEPRPDYPEYLLDPFHSFLPVPLVPMHGKSVAIVAPSGKNGKGKDPFWRHANSMAENSWGEVIYGRHAEAEKGARLMHQLILRPAVEVHRDRDGKAFATFADRKLATEAEGPASVASLVYVSGHGWMGGYINGLVLDSWNDGPDPATPETAAVPYFTSPYFFVGPTAGKGRGFHGPRWIVLAVCSVLNITTWPLWAEILAHSSPPVRGILAYEEAAPGPRPSAKVAQAFFQHLDSGLPFLDAWRIANEGKNWSAIVHKTAMHDTLPRFRLLPTDADTRTTSEIATYMGFARSVPTGQPIYMKPEPFGFKVERFLNDAWVEVLPANMGLASTALNNESTYRITISAPPGERLLKVHLQLIHIRPTYPRQFTWSNVFPVFGAAHEIAFSGLSSSTLELKPIAPTPTVSVRLDSRANLTEAGLDRGYSYLWFRASIETDETTLKYDFKTKGLCY